MDEARRFLRYVIPGLSFIVQAILLLWGLIPEWTQGMIAELRTDKGIGIVIAALFGSGGLGFIFSTVHHVILWTCRRRWLTGPVDHREFIARLRYRNILRLLDAESGTVLPLDKRPDRFEAWAIVASLWHERIETSKKIQSAEPRADSLANIVHSLGAARVASLAAVILAFLITYRIIEYSSKTLDIVRFIITSLIALFLVCLHQIAYQKTGLAAKRVVEQVLTDALVDESTTSIRPVEAHVVLESQKIK